MNKIYYFQQEVKIGDKIELNGHKVTVTKQLIKDLPDKFKVKSEDIPKYVECIKEIDGIRGAELGEILKSWHDPNKDFCYRFESKNGENGFGNLRAFYEHLKPSTKEAWLLQEAKRRYPKGTKFKDVHPNSSGLSKIKELIRNDFGIANIESNQYTYVCWWGNFNYFEESEEKWAEIVKPLFTTEDGVEIFEGDKCWFINSRELIKDENIDETNYGYWEGGSCDPLSKYFSTREAAEEYIAKHKEKTLKDYENELYAVTSISGYSVYSWLKDNDKKLYYTKVLQLIADDLKGEVDDSIEIICAPNYYSTVHASMSRSSVKFSSKSAAQKAIKIMGDKLNYIYKQ